MEKISVCIATYNSQKYIHHQLVSILCQLRTTDEIVISDDGSSDNTKELIDSLNDSRIKYYINKGEKGYTGNFENAINCSSGDIIILSDHDDIWNENKVQTTLSILKNYDFLVSDCTIIDENNKIINESYFEVRKPKKTFTGNVIKFGYLGCCMAFKRTILTKALPFPKNRRLCTHDNWLLLVSFFYYKSYISTQKLIQYRRHGNNFSNGGLTSETNLFFKIRYRLYILFNLITRLFK